MYYRLYNHFHVFGTASRIGHLPLFLFALCYPVSSTDIAYHWTRWHEFVFGESRHTSFGKGIAEWTGEINVHNSSAALPNNSIPWVSNDSGFLCLYDVCRCNVSDENRRTEETQKVCRDSDSSQ